MAHLKVRPFKTCRIRFFQQPVKTWPDTKRLIWWFEYLQSYGSTIFISNVIPNVAQKVIGTHALSS
jgi:hypothetical protein